ncbi:MAG: pilus assembly protein [Hyphomicrobiales bacterium]|nr:MAG: pilus assembly protein [Hyphomicrobiales bacterium]
MSTVTQHSRPARGPLRPVVIGTVILAAVALSACRKDPVITGSVPTDGYKTRHPIIISEAPEVLDIPVGAHTRVLSSDLAGVVVAFADRARKRGDGGIEIQVPSGANNDTAAMYVARQVRSTLINAGIRSDMIQSFTYRTDAPEAAAPIRLQYVGLKASVGQCGIWRDNLAANFENSSYSEFGCATQSNLAAMVANPADLLHPRAMTPSDPMRRATVLEKYAKGEKTGTDYGDDGAGAIANVKGGE